MEGNVQTKGAFKFKIRPGMGQVYFVGALLIVLSVFFSLASPYFNQLESYLSIIRQVTVYALIAFGMQFILLIGEIDLSVGSTVALVGVVAAEISLATNNVWLALGGALIAGILVGILNGFFITKFGIPSFIATLAMQSIIRGGVMVYTDARTIFGFQSEMNIPAQGYVGIIPIPVLVLLVAFAIVIVVLRFTRFGLNVYAIGGNKEVARLSGIAVKQNTVICFIICGFLTAIGGLIAMGRVAAATPNTGTGYELDAITAVVLGGTSMSGGSGSVVGTLLGELVLGVMSAGLIMLNISSFWITIIKGIILLLAIILSVRTTNKEGVKK